MKTARTFITIFLICLLATSSASAGPSPRIAAGESILDLLSQPPEQQSQLTRDLARKLASSLVPTPRDAETAALAAFHKIGLDMRERWDVSGLFHPGRDVPDFGFEGDLIWEIRITRMSTFPSACPALYGSQQQRRLPGFFFRDSIAPMTDKDESLPGIDESRKLLVLVGSPRRAGNSAALALAIQRGAEEMGTQVTLRFIDDFISSFLRDCRACRLPDGECSISDRFRALFFEDFLPADGVVFCSPVYWYGLSAQTKAFFDRTFCYYAASYPGSARVIERMSHKRIGLALASEETYPGASLGIIHQIQEYSRYTHSEFVGVVRGVGNSRSEVARDPGSPILAAEQLGREIFDRKYSDFRLDTQRSGRVWPAEPN